MPTTKTRLPLFGQNLILIFTGCNRLGKVDAFHLWLQETNALRFGQHWYGQPNVTSKTIAYAKFFHGKHIRSALCFGRITIGKRDDRMAATYDSSDMRKSIYLLAMLGLFAACEQKTTTVNPPAEKKESTTIVNPPSEKKETNTTIVNPPASTTKEEKTDINVNTSPNP